MLLCILLIITVSLSDALDGHYECGAHGRFEYCIDGIPGCVVGCHCHPGYFFDTDTKICEPNVKLTQDYRRHYLSEPTRVIPSPVTLSAGEEKATTAKNAIDTKIDEITNDADDLGDWLYNQFFKTIENQVINKTNDVGELTRRSDNGPSVIPVSARRSRKSKTTRKKKRKKKSGVKNKLLKITEDDSLFESDSSSSDTDSETDTDDDDDSRSGSSSSEYECDEPAKKKKKSDHGHKKIVLFNKRPKPPLPSFIFLPNMETPFYPPIGLPPPGLPMYPMVPVPPVPIFPSYPAATPYTEGNKEETTTITLTTTQVTQSTTKKEETQLPTTEHVNKNGQEHADKPDENPNNENIPNTDDKSNNDDHPNNDKYPDQNPDQDKALRTSNRGNGQRKKLMRKFRDKLKRKNKLQQYFASQYGNPFIDANLPPNYAENENVKPVNIMPNEEEYGSGMNDVDFKYLSQLIHKLDPNQTSRNFKKSRYKTTNPINMKSQLQPNRRNFYEIDNINTADEPMQYPVAVSKSIPYTQRNKVEQLNDPYYTKLGRAIAEMIRKIDSKGEREVNIEIEKSDAIPESPIFNENTYVPRAFWERSVRSPLGNSDLYKTQMDFLRKSNENLFSLENQVAIATATLPALGLQDLENFVREIRTETPKPKVAKKYNSIQRNTESSKSNYNVNLLPGNDHVFNFYVTLSPLHNRRNFNNNFDIRKQNGKYHGNIKPGDAIIRNMHMIVPNNTDRRNVTGFKLEKNIVYSMIPSIKPINLETYKNNYGPSQPNVIANIKTTFLNVATNKTTVNYPYDPMLMGRLNRNNYYPNNNPYLYPKIPMPIRLPHTRFHLPPFGETLKQPAPSYFDHELRQFDYIE